MLWLTIFSQLSIGIIIILSGGFAGVYYLWKYDSGQVIKDEIQKLEQKQNTIKEQITSMNLELQQLGEVDKAMRLMGKEMNKFLQFIPSKVTSAMILNHLNTHAKSAGVDLQGITNHSYIEKKEFYEKLKISITVKGLFSQILVFLSKLTGLTEIITVDTFNLQETRKKGKYIEGNEVIMKMDIHGYRYISSIISETKASQKEVVQ